MARVSTRRRAQEVAALAVLASSPGCWMGSVEIANAVQSAEATGLAVLTPVVDGMPAWRVIAFALRRLVEKGIVDERIITYRSAHRSKECRRQYCVARVLVRNPLFPVVHTQPPGVARRVIGRASLR